MAGFKIVIDTSRLQAALAEKSTGLNLVPFLELAGVECIKWVTKTFRDQGRPAWQALKPSTLKRRRKLGAGAKILQDSGKMRNSIVSAGSGRKLPESIYNLSNTKLEIGTNVVYAATHQFGRGAIPARPFVPEGNEPELLNAIQDKLERYMSTLV